MPFGGFTGDQRAGDDGVDRDIARVLGLRKAGILVHHPGEQALVERPPIDAYTNGPLIFDRGFDHGAEIVVVFLADIDVAGIDPVLSKSASASRVLLEKQMAVVVEVAHDGNADTVHVQGVGDLGNSRGGFFGVYRDTDQFGTGFRQGHDLIDCAGNIGRIGIGHGLHHDRVIRTDLNAANVDRNGSSPRLYRHVRCLMRIPHFSKTNRYMISRCNAETSYFPH